MKIVGNDGTRTHDIRLKMQNIKIAVSAFNKTPFCYTSLYQLSYIPHIVKGGRDWTYISGLDW